MNTTIRIGDEEISKSDPRVQQWQLNSRLFAMLRDVLNREDVQACRQVVQGLIDANYVQPIWEKLCQITEHTSDNEVLARIREVKETTQHRWTNQPGQSDRANMATPLEEVLGDD